MRIIVFGATGDVGSRTVSEALERGHAVTAAVRSTEKARRLPQGAEPVQVDIQDKAALRKVLLETDIVISAVRPPEGREETLLEMTRSIASTAFECGVRILVVGGAARLKIPGAGGDTVLTKPGFLPAAVVPIAKACQAQFEWIQGQECGRWSYISPPAMLLPGTRQGTYRLGKDTLVMDGEGSSAISMEDLAVALLDEAEAPRHTGRAFTVGY